MRTNRDYTSYSFLIALLVLAMLAGISFIPPTEVLGVRLKRANIFSDLYSFNDPVFTDGEAGSSGDDDAFLEELDSLHAKDEDTKEDVLEQAAEQVRMTYARPQTSTRAMVPGAIIPVMTVANITHIEDFGETMAHFYNALDSVSYGRYVRVAVLGDSYIEGDIITADLREQLQTTYGGHGTGFVPFSSPFLKLRNTLSHSAEGWTDYNLVNYKNVPEEYQPMFTVSGILSIPGESATASFGGTKARKHLMPVARARIFFINQGNTTITVSVNGGEACEFEPETSELMQCITINQSIEKIDITVANGEGFIGYGVSLDDGRGINIDNFSLRSNSGTMIGRTSVDINRQFDRMMGYDLIIIQYGLNAMSPDVEDYGYYTNQMARVINHIKGCFPRASILVMGVGDRSTLQDGNYVTMSAVYAMAEAQRSAAEKSGAAFWSTFDAMGGEGSMPGFVERNWAAKDYTHLSHGGGRYIATQLVNALYAGRANVATPEKADKEPRPQLPGGETVILLTDTLRPIPPDTSAVVPPDPETRHETPEPTEQRPDSSAMKAEAVPESRIEDKDD